MIPLIQNEVVLKMNWLSPFEFLDAIAFAQLTPGPIALNVATYAGHQTGGIFGGVVATAGVVMPSFMISLALAVLFSRVRGHMAYQNVLEIIKLVAIALIVSTAILLWPNSIIDSRGILIFAASFLLFNLERFNPALIIILAGFAGLIVYA